MYEHAWLAERFEDALGSLAEAATRYEKRAVNYRAMVIIASLMMWLSS